MFIIFVVFLLICVFTSFTIVVNDVSDVHQKDQPDVIADDRNITNVKTKKKKNKKPVIMHFAFSVDNERLGRILGEKSMNGEDDDKLFADKLAKKLKGIIPDEQIERIVALKDEDGFVPISKITELGFPTRLHINQLRIDLTVPPQYKQERRKSISPNRITDNRTPIEPAWVSGALNCRVSRSERGKTSSNTGVFSPNINIFGLNIEGQISGSQSTGQKTKWHRDKILATYDFRESSNRLTFGDISSYTTDYQSVPRLWGIGFNHFTSKEERSLSQDIHLEILRPSIVKIYANDVLVQTEKLFPGTYVYDDIPFKYGSNDVRIEIIDDTGKTTYIDQVYYRDGNILDVGEFAYGVSGGKPEINVDGQRYFKKNMFATYVKTGLFRGIEGDFGYQKNHIGQLRSYSLIIGNVLGTFTLSLAQTSQKQNTNQTDNNTTTASTEKIKGLAKKLRFSSAFFQLSNVNVNMNLELEQRNRAFMPYLRDESDFNKFFSKMFSNNSELGILKGSKRVSKSIGLSIPSVCSVRYSDTKKWYTDKTWESTKTMSFNKNIRFSEESDFSSGSFVMEYTVDRKKGERARKSFSLGGCINFKNNISVSSYASRNYVSGTKNTYSMNTTLSYSDPESFPINGNISKSNSSTSRGYACTLHYNSENLKGDFNYSHHTSGGKVSTSRQAALETNIYFADGTFALSEKNMGTSGFVIVTPSEEVEQYPISLQGKKKVDTGNVVDTVPYDSTKSFAVRTSGMPFGMKLKNRTFHALGEYKRGAVVVLESEGGSCAIKGFIKYQNGKPVSKSRGYIRLLGGDKKDKIPFFTNKKGKFSLYGLKPGEYELVMKNEILVSPVRFALKPRDDFRYQKIGTLYVLNYDNSEP